MNSNTEKNKIYGCRKQKRTFQEFFSLFFVPSRIQFNEIQFHFSDLINNGSSQSWERKTQFHEITTARKIYVEIIKIHQTYEFVSFILRGGKNLGKAL